MCSISGFYCKNGLKKEYAERLARGLIYYGQDRGDQSSGAFLYGEKERLLKMAIHPRDFVATKEFSQMFAEPSYRVGLFHTRFPTSGGRSDKDAQPFRRNETVTVHNGVYRNCSQLMKKFNLVKKTEVDSELVTDFIESYGIRMLPDFIDESSGVSAIAAFYKGNLYLARQGNPISYCRLKWFDDSTITVFASTQSMLESAVRYTILCNDLRATQLTEGEMFLVTNDQLVPFGSKFKKWGYEYNHTSKYYPGYGYCSSGSGYQTKYDQDEDEDTVDWIKGDGAVQINMSKKNRKKFRQYMRERNKKNGNSGQIELSQETRKALHLTEGDHDEITKKTDLTGDSPQDTGSQTISFHRDSEE